MMVKTKLRLGITDLTDDLNADSDESVIVNYTDAEAGNGEDGKCPDSVICLNCVPRKRKNMKQRIKKSLIQRKYFHVNIIST